MEMPERKELLGLVPTATYGDHLPQEGERGGALHLSSILPATSDMVRRITRVSAGHTIICPIRLTTILKAVGYTCTFPTSSVSQSREMSAVKMAAVRPALSLTGCR